MGNLILVGLGFSLLKCQVSNYDLVGCINMLDEFIVECIGVCICYYVELEQVVSVLMVLVVCQVIEVVGLLLEDIDLLLVNILLLDYYDLFQVCLIQLLLGLWYILVLDIWVQCSGLLYGLQMVCGQIFVGLVWYVLVVCGEVLFKCMDCLDCGCNLLILFGDGVGVVVVSVGESFDDGLLDLCLGVDGNYFDLLMIVVLGSVLLIFFDENVLCEGGGEFFMCGWLMFEYVSQILVWIVGEMFVVYELILDDIDYVICY